MLNCRQDFPSLNLTYNNRPLAYFDGPAGTQVPQKVIDAISGYYKECNANTHGYFLTSRESDKIISLAREHMAVFLNAPNAECISFGANMTTLNYALSKALLRTFKPGDEVVITQLDHEANRGPWLMMQDNGIIVREAALKNDGTIDYQDLKSKINKRTKLVAMGMASNALGTVNDVRTVRRWTQSVDALLLLDAVHFAPHFSIDVQYLETDFLLCSAYKFYGPHVGIIYSKPGLLDRLPTDCLRTQTLQAPFKIETGTLNHAALAGVKAAIEYIASIVGGSDLRDSLKRSMNLIGDYEHFLADKFYNGLLNIKNVMIYGPPMIKGKHTPTVSFLMSKFDAPDVCRFLASRAICAWDGHFYAIRPIELLGLLERGGLTRIGMSLYNTEDEVDRLLETIEELSNLE